MLKKIILALCLSLSVFTLQANASLMGVSDTLLYDNQTSQYWYRNISEFSGGTGGVDKALQWIPNNYYGLNTWHLASLKESTSLVTGTTTTDLVKYFPSTGAGVFVKGSRTGENMGNGNYKYWVGGTNSYSLLNTLPPLPIAMNIFAVRVNYDLIDLAQINPLSMVLLEKDGPQWNGLSEVGAWVTAYGPAPGSQDSTPAPVPEPGTMLLLGSGLMSLAGIRGFKKNWRAKRLG